MQPESDQNRSRREWMVQVLRAAGTSVFAAEGFALQHLHPTAVSDAANGTWRPAFFSEQQNEALVSLGECIIPGSTAAYCNRVIDLILTLESDKTRRQIVDALAAFDSAAGARQADSFRKLRPQEQAEILTEAASGKGSLAPHFAVIKEWIADAYWSSQEGMRELGWKGRVAWASFDGCPHREGHSQS
jgi:gluconate 2-dehydrogenase subunit 3-like protein